MKYTRIVNNTAFDVRTESPAGCFTTNIVAEFVEVPDDVGNGWTLSGNTWSAPVIPEPVIPEPVAPVPPKVSPVEFMLLFTSTERVAIKAARVTDPIIDDFLDIIEDPRLTSVDLALGSTQDALSYFTALDILAAGRKAAILTGVIA